MIPGPAIAAFFLVSSTLAAQEGQPRPVTLKPNEAEFELTLHGGHLLKESEEKTRYLYERALGAEDWKWLRVSVTVGKGAISQQNLPTDPRRVLAATPLPGNATLSLTRVPWEGLDLLAAEYSFIQEEENFEIFGFAAVVPLVPDALTIDVAAAKVYEFNVREELKQILASVKGKTNWLTPAEEKKLGYLIWPGIAAVVLGASYLPVWLIFFRGLPWRAHLLRVLWQVAVGLAFFSGFMLSITFGDILEKSGQSAPFLCWPVVALPGMLCYVGLAFRRIVLHIDG